MNIIELAAQADKQADPGMHRWAEAFATLVRAEREWVDATPQEVTALIMEGAAGGGWQGFAQRLSAFLKEKNGV